MTIRDLKKRFQAIVSDLGAKGTWADFPGQPHNDGRAHCEYRQGKYYYIYTERGSVVNKRTTEQLETILCWLITDLTDQLAYEFMSTETKKTKTKTDERRIWFDRHVELLRLIEKKWASRQRSKYARILKDAPYEDG